MKYVRFVLPFLFERNWNNGAWELSRARLFVFLAGLFILFLALFIAYMLQSAVVYTA